MGLGQHTTRLDFTGGSRTMLISLLGEQEAITILPEGGTTKRDHDGYMSLSS
jgi:hypothetical protein